MEYWTHELPAPMIKTSVSIVLLSARSSLPKDESSFSFSGCWVMWSTQVDKTQIFQVNASSILMGKRTILPAHSSWGELIQKDKLQSMNIFKANRHPSAREVTKIYYATHHDWVHDNEVRITLDPDSTLNAPK